MVKGVRYYIRQEYKIIDEYKNKYSIKLLCEYMSVSRSGYYKWKYRQEHPTLKMLSRQSDINLIKEIHEKHPSHGYRWINAYARSYYDGLKQVLKRIKKEQTDDLIILHTDQGSVYSSKAYNKLLDT